MSYKSSFSVIIIVLYSLAICGKSQNAKFVEVSDQKKAEAKISGGTFAKQNDTLHQVSIRIIEMEKNKGFGEGHHCGGTLISSSLVLTAAHCMYVEEYINDTSSVVWREYRKDELIIVMGTLDRTNKTKDTISRTTEDWTIHPKFDIDIEFPKNIYNDVAIIKLNESVPTNIPTIKPLSDLGSEEIKDGTLCAVTGWGSIENRTLPEHLLTVTVPVISTKRCNASADGLMDEGMICAGNMNQSIIGPCRSDDGGPFVCNQKLYGIVSLVNSCGFYEDSSPGVYSNVSYFKSWIDAESIKLTGNGSLAFLPNNYLSIMFAIITVITCALS